MEKKGRYFTCETYQWTTNRPMNHFPFDNASLEDALPQHRTLSKIKKDFGTLPYLFTCVIEGHLTAPTTLFQYIVDCPSQEVHDRLKPHYAAKSEYSLYNVHVKYPWLDNVPPDILTSWLAY